MIRINQQILKKCIVGIACLVAQPALAESFIITDAQTKTNGLRAELKTGETGTVAVTGSIATVGPDRTGGFGFYARAPRTTLKNFGKITTNGDLAHGMIGVGSQMTYINNGLIRTLGSRSSGIFNNSVTPRSVLTNEGTIITEGFNTFAMFSLGRDTVMTNTGLIQATGNNNRGLLADNSDRRLANSANYIRLTNSGRIIMSGARSYGVYTGGRTHSGTITNSGLIQATGKESTAIWVGGTKSTVNLNKGSVIAGNILLVHDDTKLNVGKGLSIANTFSSSGTSFTILTKGRRTSGFAPGSVTAPDGIVAVHGLHVAVVDKQTQSLVTVQDEVLGDLTSDISSVVQSRVNPLFHGVNEFIADGSSRVWAKAFGSYRNINGNDFSKESDVQLGGLVSGIDGMGWNDMRLGVFFGAAVGDVDKTDMDSFFGGVYASKLTGKTNISFVTTGGYIEYDETKRLIANNTSSTGLETATSQLKGVFISPELTLTSPLWTGMKRLEKSFKVQYAGLFLDKATEKGTTAPLSWDARDIHVLLARGTLTLPSELPLANGGTFRNALYVGIEGRAQTGGSDLTGTLLSQKITVKTGGSGSTAAAFAGFTLDRSFGDGLALFAGAEGQYETDGAYRVSGNAGVKFRF